MTTATEQDDKRGRRWTEYVRLPDILKAPRNPKKHARAVISRSISKFGIVELPAIDERTGRLVAGHGRLKDWQDRRAAGEEPPDGITLDEDGEWLVPVSRGWASRSDPEAEAYLLVSNQSTIAGGWDDAELAEALAELRDADEDLLALTGFEDDEIGRLLDDYDLPGGGGDGGGGGGGEGNPRLADRFLIPPFDVLDARSGWWRERKRMWLDLGIQSEIGRAGRLVYDSPSSHPAYYQQKREMEERLDRKMTNAEFEAGYWQPPGSEGVASGTSVFDPVLCELSYRWYSAPGAIILDPFAGGSVRGVVAGALDRIYLGNDLSGEQVEANRQQVADIVPDASIAYTVGDSATWVDTLEPESVDLIFTCPPYYDLESYSDDPADLSRMDYEDFDATYARIIAGAAAALRPDRFAVFVVGDARDNKGGLHDLRGSTIRACEAAGLMLINAGVLVTAVGSLAVRAARQFVSGRVLGRSHQDVLVFCKGSRKAAATWCGDVEVHVPDELVAAAAEAEADETPDAPLPENDNDDGEEIVNVEGS